MNQIVSGTSFPAIKGMQAKTEYYIVMCPLKRLSKIFTLDEGQLPVDQRAQRIINEERIPDIANSLYQGLKDAGVDVLFDDRKERPGVMFNDMELVGVPFTLVIGERNLDENKVELKNRRTGEKLMIDIDTAIESIKAAMQA